VDYRDIGETWIPTSEMVSYTADDRVKLSHHWDGFVQFSGQSSQKIISGRDPSTGQPKGLGLLSAPIRVPITTGPTFGMSIWGIEDFAEHHAGKRQLVFNSMDMYYRGCTPSEASGYMIEGWVFGHRMWAGVRGSEADLRLSVGFRNFEGSGANLEFKVIPLEPPSRQFLGILVARTNPDFPSPSGFMLTAPSNRRADNPIADAMMAMYPRFESMPLADAADLNFELPVL
jgi:hypothetical protein